MIMKKFTGKKVAFGTLGCKLNYAETSAIADNFTAAGFQTVPMSGNADVFVINTCSVTHQADRKCRQMITKIYRNNPDAFIAVTGCYAQLKSEEIAALPGVDLVLGTNYKFSILEHLDSLEKKAIPEIYSCGIEKVTRFDPGNSTGERTRAFLKVQDGCDYHCSYCTIPLARGRSRNESIAETVKKAAQLGATNIREIVLTGVNTGDFGKSTGETFIELLRAIDNLDNIDRVRISSIEPNLLTDEIIDLVKSSGKFMPHFHVPLQSGCNEILAKMRRRYKRELFAKVVDKIRDRLPDAGIGVDVITGFPGETEEAFLNTFQFIKNLNISYLHVFTYSERKNTGAAIMDGKVSNTEKTRRSKMLLALSDEKRKDFYHKNLGKLHPVLFESKNKNGIMTGFTDNYIKTETPYQPSLINNICPVILKKITDNGNVSGELAKV